MQISLRYTTDDQFWITFFHEAGHILLHGKRDVFLETAGHSLAKEEAADQFALQQLLPKGGMSRFASVIPPTRESIKRFAASQGLAPGVLVGMLQQTGELQHSHFNDLKRLFKLEA
jgi:Zn-dependent peptidase ImmA (M78 family)